MKSFGAAKQRLAQALGAGARQALAQAMFTDVLGTLRHAPGVDEIAVVTADHVAEAAATAKRVRVLPDTAQAGQSEAALIGIRYALAAGYERALLVPGDTPLLEPRDLVALLEGDAVARAPGAPEAGGREPDAGRAVVIVPDRHGTGTNALVLSPPDAIEPSFGPGSLERHVAAAEAAGLEPRVEEVATLALDVDTPGDLAALVAELERRRGHAPSTRGVLRQLDRAGARPARVAQVSG